MKFSNFGRATLAAMWSLGVAATFTACGRTGTNNTVDYVFVTNSKNNPGQVNVYYADANSGGLAQIADSPYPSGGRNPVGLVTSPDFKSLYVINHDENTIVQFGIGTDAKLYPQHTYNSPGTFPNSIAINSAGTYLFVTDTYQPQYTAANPGPGALAVFPISPTDGSLGTPVANGNLAYYPLSTGQTDVLNPIAVNAVTENGASFIYVASQDSTTGAGEISAFQVASDGTLTYIPCSISTAPAASCSSTGDGNFNAGVAPSAIATSPLGRFLFVTDSASNRLLSYVIHTSDGKQDGTPDGQLVSIAEGAINITDVQPDAVTVDPRGQYIYVANYAANDINAYMITQLNPSTSPNPNLLLIGVSSVGSYATGTGPTCVFVEPNLGSYIYTTNFLDNTISGLNLDLTTGTLAPVQNTPFLAAGQPTCIAATPHNKRPLITPAN